MGTFDTIINSYKPLGEKYLNVALQTKSLYNCMEDYWISPNGELYNIDYYGCFSYKKNPDYNSSVSIHRTGLISPVIAVCTGNRGKVTPCWITEKVVLHAGIKDNSWTNIVLYFKLGQLQTYKFKTHEFPTITK